jgi:tRNA-2-methylthio-N6-dimethylallyladenosine synthase
MMVDDVSEDEKWERFRAIEKLQEGIFTEIHAAYLNKEVTVLFEEKMKNRWKGRTPNNKLVFVDGDENLLGQIRQVHIYWTGPWSMIGRLT